MSFSEELKQALKRTTQLLNTDIRDAFKPYGRPVDGTLLNGLFEILTTSGMDLEAARKTVDDIGTTFRGRVVQVSDVLHRVKQHY